MERLNGTIEKLPPGVIRIEYRQIISNRGLSKKNVNGFGKTFIKQCIICGREIKVKLCRLERTKTCSVKCRVEYKRRQNLSPDNPCRRPSKIIKIENGIVYLGLRYKKETFIAMLDEEDLDLVAGKAWHVLNNHADRNVTGNFYGVCNIGLMHRVILGLMKQKNRTEDQVDHINGNGLDNRKSNLRVVTGSINMHNQHKYTKGRYLRGTWPANSGKKFLAKIKVNNKIIHLGVFATEVEAHEAYKKAKKKYLP